MLTRSAAASRRSLSSQQPANGRRCVAGVRAADVGGWGHGTMINRGTARVVQTLWNQLGLPNPPGPWDGSAAGHSCSSGVLAPHWGDGHSLGVPGEPDDQACLLDALHLIAVKLVHMTEGLPLLLDGQRRLHKRWAGAPTGVVVRCLLAHGVAGNGKDLDPNHQSHGSRRVGSSQDTT